MSSCSRNHRPVIGATVGLFAGVALIMTGCAGGAETPAVTTSTAASPSATQASGSDTSNADHPDVIDADLQSNDDGTWQLAVTLSSLYDSPERYADGWRVLDEDGEVLGEHTLTHDHATEQPVTRTQNGLDIPDDVDLITIEGSDTANGYGGATLEVVVDR